MLGSPTRRSIAAFTGAILLAAACSSGAETSGSGASSSGSGASSTSAATTTTGGAGRPEDPTIVKDIQGRAYDLAVPPGLDASTPAPLLVLLHGYSPSKTAPHDMDAFMGISPVASKRGVIVAFPRGTYDSVLNRYEWNATEACCGFDTPDANDVGYVMAMIDEIAAKYKIDEKRIFLVGHSNGGFMAHRLACDQADKIAAIVSLAGGTFKNPSKCAASAPISVLQVHGDADDTIAYAGGPPLGLPALPSAPGAMETVADWAMKNRCGTTPDGSAPALDIVSDLAGAETTKLVYSGCEAAVATELWTIHGGSHVPALNDAWATDVLDFLMAHPKP